MASQLVGKNSVDHASRIYHRRMDYEEAGTYDEHSALLDSKVEVGNDYSKNDMRYGCISTSYGEPAYGNRGEPSSADSFDCDELSCTTDTFVGPEERLKRRVKYFFMNPLEKWKTKGKFPWKLVLQLVKIVFVTVQLCIFGTDGYLYEVQKQNIGASFRHIFLKDWLPIREVVSYPPSTGPYAVYTKPEFYSNADHVVRMYSNITNLSLGPYEYTTSDGKMGNLTVCKYEFAKMAVKSRTILFDGRVNETCHPIIPLYPAGDPLWGNFSFKDYMESINCSIMFDKLVRLSLRFSLQTVFLKNLANVHIPDCYYFNISIDYDNSKHDGQIVVALQAQAVNHHCHQEREDFSNGGLVFRQVLNIFIILIGVLSLILCIRCLHKGRLLWQETDKYFLNEHRKPLSASEKLEFIDGWYCMMIINDVLIIAGSVLKACVEKQTVESDQYATCAILLGTGNLLVWAGVLRYLGFFRKYNILILTLKTALPNVLRFMLCCVLLYGGFCFCGWVVLGPYHIKFRTLSTTSECLFAMMNGDDLFATFAITDTNNPLIWWFSRIYLYLFISIFIYVVISLFISVIMDSYETVKEYYRHGSPLSRIQSLIADCTEDSCSSFYRLQRSQRPSRWNRLSLFCHGKGRKNKPPIS